jgi:O-methyltransferase involved in polyketide biosynthesis
VWEGVVPYLRAADVRATVGQIASLSAPGSRLVVNYQAKSAVVTVMRPLMRVVLRVARQPDPMAGEPWRSLWRPPGIRSLLQDKGFDVESDHDLLELAAGLDLPTWGDASLRNGRVALATRR